ncbi:MAG: asparagine synthase (glutamine-hydrolyzing) [Bryobacteraceae bacterium]
MCGITGFVTAGKGVDPGLQSRVLERMANVIEHRGPDEFGYFHDDLAWLGHRRLSIVDLATGKQPMTNEDGTVHLSYNGEIFNHMQVRPELLLAGHRFHTRSDTEVIVHGYEQFGPEAVTRFNGMFAWALWDQKKKRLYCARDRHGIKPFYYWWDGKLFAFASEIKSLFEHPEIAPKLNESALNEYFTFGFVSSEETLFQGIKKLMPAHYLVLDCAGSQCKLSTHQYWETPLFEKPETWSEAEAVKECRLRLEECVRSRLMADVPLGMFLSGGVDSSAIAAILRREFSGPVKTFSVGYQEAEFGELTWAHQVADRIGTEHHEIVIGFDEFFTALPKMVWHEDEPICFSSSIPLYYLSKLAQSEVKVVLTGEGADELFAGYERYRYHLINEQASRFYGVVPSFMRGMMSRALEGPLVPSLSLRRKLQHTFLYRTSDIESMYLDNFYCGFPGHQLEDLAKSRLIGSQSPYASFLNAWNTGPQQSTLSRLLFADHKTYLVELLMKQDQMSMAASIESRVPFLDHTFVEFAMRLPDSLKLPNKGKYVLKKAVEDLLPADIIYRSKMGFPTPLRRWLSESRSDFLMKYLTDPRGLLAAYFDTAKLGKLVERHRASTEDATDRIWRLLNFQIWGDLFFTGRKAQWMGEELSLDAMRHQQLRMPAPAKVLAGAHR